MTLEELIAQCKAENPTMTATINNEEYQLSPAEYEEAVLNWATMRLEQLAAEYPPLGDQCAFTSYLYHIHRQLKNMSTVPIPKRLGAFV